MKKKIYPIIALSFAIMMSACGGKKAAEPSSVEKEETEKATREVTEKETKEETEKEEASDAKDLIVPGYALGEIPAIPAVEINGLGIFENPAAKITMDKTEALSSVPGITVTPVKLENDQIFRGNSVMQLGEGGAGQMSSDGLTVQTDGNGAGQYVDAERGFTIQRNTDGSGQYVDEQKGITLQVNSDGTGQYSDDGQGITLQVSEGGNGIFTDTKKEITMMVSDDSTSYTQGSIDIDVKPDGSGSYYNSETGLSIKNDGQGKAVISLGNDEKTVDARPLEKPTKLPKLSMVPAVPSLEANSLLITLDSGVLFDVDKYDIRPDAEKILNDLATVLKEGGITAFQIDGHTDSMDTYEHNQVLSENRANSVKSYLASQGVTAEITTHGYGESRPVATNDTAEGRQQNRRVEIIVPTA